MAQLSVNDAYMIVPVVAADGIDVAADGVEVVAVSDHVHRVPS